MGGETIEAEHLLLAMLRADQGVLPKIFADAGVFYGDVRMKVRGRWEEQARPPTTADIRFADVTERIFQAAEEEAGNGTVGTGHLMIGLLREEHLFAAEMLTSHGLTVEGVRAKVRQAEPEAKTPAREGEGMWVVNAAFDPIRAVERIRIIVDMWAMGELEQPRPS